MILIKTVKIEEFRGIRELTLDLGRENYGICGPNGTGKSGIVDAIEFCLTGSITRLSGQGQGELSVKGHAPHVDQRDSPEKAKVTIEATIPSLGKDITISRSVKSPSAVTIVPESPQASSIVAELQSHPEFALSRREIAKYIITPPANRSADVQNLLRLDLIGNVRKSLLSYSNRYKRDSEETERSRSAAERDLNTALSVTKIDQRTLLQKVNEHRAILGLSELTKLTANTNFREGATDPEKSDSPASISKDVALADVKIIEESIEAGEPQELRDHRDAAVADLRTLKEDEQALIVARRHGFITTGLSLVTDDACPLCDEPWDADELRSHLKAKILDAEAIGVVLERLRAAITSLVAALEDRIGTIQKVGDYAAKLDPAVPRVELDAYAQSLVEAKEALTAFQDDHAKIEAALGVLEHSWWILPEGVQSRLEETKKGLAALPERSAKDKAIEFLTEIQVRFNRLMEATRASKIAAKRYSVAKFCYENYTIESNNVLEDIYNDVSQEFSRFYKSINDDEGDFSGELKAEPAKLNFNVDFYGRGPFPPGAYHSEGHQDGMGLCLYLALMKHTLGDKFTFAVLDDVMMSVDTGHRREVCRLLKTEFPNTQFILTTHDRVWLQYMRTEGLIKRSQFFSGWSVDVGPQIWDDTDVWTELDVALNLGDVARSAALLRRYLEYISMVLADNLRAQVEYRGDANYDLGDLLPPVMSRWRTRLEKGIKSAAHWGHEEEKARVEAKLSEAKKLIQNSNTEQWAINKSVHFNEWSNFTPPEFRKVTDVFKELLDHIRCPNEKCGGFPYVTPRKGSSEQLRCSCGAININLKTK